MLMFALEHLSQPNTVAPTGVGAFSFLAHLCTYVTACGFAFVENRPLSRKGPEAEANRARSSRESMSLIFQLG